jgi:SAM-dependent methyltransferase
VLQNSESDGREATQARNTSGGALDGTHDGTPAATMTLGRRFYGLAYRIGRPRWDRDQTRPELVALIAERAPGRALDLGCGTGRDAVFLADHGWDVVGVDFVEGAIKAARRRACNGTPPRFLVGDVTRLRAIGVEGPFDLVLDVGCYHGVPTGARRGYAAEVAAVTRPGADLLIAGISDPPASWRILGARGVDAADLRRHFGDRFDLDGAGLVGADPPGRGGGPSHFAQFHLVRR